LVTNELLCDREVVSHITLDIYASEFVIANVIRNPYHAQWSGLLEYHPVANQLRVRVVDGGSKRIPSSAYGNTVR